jgi:hypothetical protein
MRETVRVRLPAGEVGYLDGPAVVPLWVALPLGLVAVALAWAGIGFCLARRWRSGLGDALHRLAPAYWPLVLLSVDAARLLLPLGAAFAWLTNPLTVLTYEGRSVVVAAVGLAMARQHVRLFAPSFSPWRPSPGRLAWGTFVLVLAGYLAFMPRALLVGPTGDEPDYLLVSHSMVVDRDLDLENNLARQDYRRFVERLPKPHVRPRPASGLYDVHRLGLSIAIAPAYAVGLAAGWPLRTVVVVFLALVVAAIVARMVGWAATLTGHAPSAVAAGVLVAFGAPGFFYAYAIYPEVPVALVVLELWRRLSEPASGRTWPTGTLLATLPWFHEKFLLLTVVLTGIALRRAGRAPRPLAGLLVPLGVSALLQAAYYWWLYGRPLPAGHYPLFPPPHALGNGFLGLWLDRDHGLLLLAPGYLLALVGFGGFWRERRQAALIGLLAFASLYGVVAAYREWWGGFSPAPRYLVPVVPLLGVAAAFGIRTLLGARRGVRVLCLVGSSVLVAAFAVIFPALQYRHAHPLRSLFGGIDWTRYLPSWLFPDERTLPLTMLVVGLAVAWVYARLPAVRARPDGAPRPLAPGVAVILLVTAAIVAGDLVSGAHGPHLPQEGANAALVAFLRRADPAGLPEPALRLRGPGRPRPESLQLVYEAEALPGRAHGTVEDALAANGFARAGGRAGDDLIFGPYEVLPRGRYRATFRVRGEPDTPPGEVGILGVSGANGRLPLGVLALRGADLTSDAYRDVSIDFALEAETPGLEWRVRLARADALRVDRIAVSPLTLAAAVRDPA